MTLREMLLAQLQAMHAEIGSAIEHAPRMYGDDGYDDMSNGLEFLQLLVDLDYELTEDQAVEAVEALFTSDRYESPVVAAISLDTRPAHMIGLDSLADSIRDEYYRRHPEEAL